MRYLKIASAKNPNTDFIELNDFYGFLCTQFQTLGINRQLEFLAIDNRQFETINKTNFREYVLTIEILTNYSKYDEKYKNLLNFFDRNKKYGLQLYFKPSAESDLRYCLCSLKSTEKTNKMQPITVTLVQTSLWLGDVQKITTSYTEESGNIFEFKNDDDIENYYCVSFSEDENISNYYCVLFARDIATKAIIKNNSYNSIPLIVRIKGTCISPVITITKQGETQPIKTVKIFATVNEGYYLEINSNIMGNGIWLVNEETEQRVDYTELVDNSFGSPYIFVDNGEYLISVADAGNNECITDIFYQEEYSE